MNDWQTILICILFVAMIPLSLCINTTYGSGFRYIVIESGQNKSGEIELVGNVTHVVDGDTLDINGIRIRLSLVDTPERGQPGFKEAKDYVTTLCLGKKGELDVDNGQRRGDRYGRELGVVYCNGININEQVMNKGLARILTNYCDISEFSKEKWAAACSNLGMTVGQ